MNVLIVTAHPARYGFAHAIANTYKKEKEKRHDSVFIMDLYKKKYAQPFLTFQDLKSDCHPTATHKLIHEKITWADEIVLVFPVWWFGVPAIMKNFIDQNLTPGFAYKYNAQGIPHGLLKGKTARMFLTADSSKWVYFVFRISILMRWRYGILGFCGITLRTLDIFTGMIRKRSDVVRDRMLERVAERAHAYLPLIAERTGVRKVQ